MTELLALTSTWYAFPLGLAIFGLSLGFLPAVALTLVLLLYPKDHPRRDEFRGEFDAITSYFERVLWVSRLLENGLREGCPARARNLVRAFLEYRERKGQESELYVDAVLRVLTAITSWLGYVMRRANRRVEQRIVRVDTASPLVSSPPDMDGFYDETWVVNDSDREPPSGDA